jgi:hypothetical protein
MVANRCSTHASSSHSEARPSRWSARAAARMQGALESGAERRSDLEYRQVLRMRTDGTQHGEDNFKVA